jgi:helix-turn-helix protein
MTGEELRAARERLGVSAADLAARAGVPADTLARWEASAVPRFAAYRLDRALWELERDAALAQSDLPACEWVARYAALPAGPRKDPWALEQHIGRCPACQARGHYVEQHVRPRPENPWAAWLPPFPRAVLAGALLALVASGGVVAALILLVMGLAGRDANLLTGAAGVFVVCAAAGGLGGAVHYLTWPLRRAGRVGLFVARLLTVESALFLAVGLVALGAWRGLAGLGPDEFRVVVNPLTLLAVAAVGVVGSLAVGGRWGGGHFAKNS